jgi:two-component system sensor histidine kinase AtoS
VLVLGTEGIIAYGNQRAHELFGAALVGAGIEAVFAPMDRLESSMEEGRKGMEIVDRRTGEPRQIGYRLSVLEHGPAGPERFVLVCQDITEARRLRLERDSLLQIAAVNDVLPSILHEIKNPLASIRSTVELLVEEAKDGPLREELHAVLTEIRRITLTLDGVGRFRHDLRSSKPHPIDQACLEALSVLQPPAREKGFRVVAEVPTLPLLAFDPGGIRAIVYNLFTNAMQACKPGNTITLKLQLQAGWLALEVADTGSGMSPEVLSRCQEIFFTTRAKGTGIGLALCASLAKSAGGTLEVNSIPGAGTQVVLRVPVEPVLSGGIHVESGRPESDPAATPDWNP